MIRLTLVAVVFLATSCSKKKEPPKLPEEINYRVNFFDADKTHVISQVPSLVGAKLTLNGEPVATLNGGAGSSEVWAVWKGPKAGVNAVASGTFAIRTESACGPFELKIDGQPESWRPLKDEALAPYLRGEGQLEFSNWITVPPSVAVFVDRGASTAEVKVGEAVITGAKTTLSLGGCTGALPVSIGEEKVGELAPGVERVLVTAEPGVCHTMQEVGYGSYKSGPVVKLAAAPVTTLRSEPIHFLESAPRAQQVGGGGTVSSELLRAPCDD